MTLRIGLLLGSAFCVACVTDVRSQCTHQFIPVGAERFPTASLQRTTGRLFDPDGSGPALPRVVTTGSNAASSFDGLGVIGGGYGPGTLRCGAWYDPDGVGGPIQPSLYVADTTEDSVSRVAGPNQGLVPGRPYRPVNDMLVWDFDGDGPLGEELIVAGGFDGTPNLTSIRIIRYNGTQWNRFTTQGLNGEIFSIGLWDRDGNGPERESLYAGGSFTTSEGTILNRVARWTGSVWEPLGPGLNGSVNIVKALDADGDGPLPKQLYIGGTFTARGDGTGSVRNIAVWDGAILNGLGNGPTQSVSMIDTFDADGAALGDPTLVVGSSPFVALSTWDGATWVSRPNLIGGAFYNLPPSADAPVDVGGFYVAGMRYDPQSQLLAPTLRGVRTAYAIGSIDTDKEGPRPTEVIIGCSYVFNTNSAFAASETALRNLSTPSDSRAVTFQKLDPDGTGPLPVELYVGFDYPGIYRVTATGMASAATPQINSGPGAFASFDRDGAGPELSNIY